MSRNRSKGQDRPRPGSPPPIYNPHQSKTVQSKTAPQPTAKAAVAPVAHRPAPMPKILPVPAPSRVIIPPSRRHEAVQPMIDRTRPRLGGPSLEENPNWNPFSVLADEERVERALAHERRSQERRALAQEQRAKQLKADCKEIWDWIESSGKARDVPPKMYYVFVGKPQSQCHHFAFGNLEGNRDDFTLSKIFKETVEARENRMLALYAEEVEDVEQVLREELGDKVCPTGKWGKNGPEQTVCLLGTTKPPTDHSCRQEVKGGLWWHKFIDLPYVLGFKTPLIFGYRVAEYIKARTPKGNYDARKMLWKRPT